MGVEFQDKKKINILTLNNDRTLFHFLIVPFFQFRQSK